MRGGFLTAMIHVCVVLSVPLLKLAIHASIFVCRVIYRIGAAIFSSPKPKTPPPAIQPRAQAPARAEPRAGVPAMGIRTPPPNPKAAPTTPPLTFRPTDHAKAVNLLCDTITEHYSHLSVQTLNEVSCPGDALIDCRKLLVLEFAQDHLKRLVEKGGVVDVVDTPEFRQSLFDFAKSRRFGIYDVMLRPMASVQLSLSMKNLGQQRSTALTTDPTSTSDDNSRGVV